jgi:hypothetical protein
MACETRSRGHKARRSGSLDLTERDRHSLAADGSRRRVVVTENLKGGGHSGAVGDSITDVVAERAIEDHHSARGLAGASGVPRPVQRGASRAVGIGKVR